VYNPPFPKGINLSQVTILSIKKMLAKNPKTPNVRIDAEIGPKAV
jgi:hypothetical protein